MSEGTEGRGRTVREAIDHALARLDVGEEDVDVQVLEEGNRGLFGLVGGRQAAVRLTVKPTRAAVAGELIEAIGRAMNIPLEVRTEGEGEYLFVAAEAAQGREGDLGALIGRRGWTLDALQYLVNVAAGRHGRGRGRIVLDVGGYRARREETLRRLAKRLASQVKRTGDPITLDAMSALERRIIHLALQGDPEVVTRSVGVEPYRKVVIAYGGQER